MIGQVISSEHTAITRAVETGRRMRAAIFAGPNGSPVPNAKEILRQADELPRLAGRLALTRAIGGNMDPLRTDLENLLKMLEPAYRAYLMMMASAGITRDPSLIADGVILLADSWHNHLVSGSGTPFFDFNGTTKTHQELMAMLTSEPHQVASLTADKFALDALAETLGFHATDFGGLTFDTTLAAVHSDGSQVVLPDNAPKSNYGVYIDGSMSGQTRAALEAALLANSQRP